MRELSRNNVYNSRLNARYNRTKPVRKEVSTITPAPISAQKNGESSHQLRFLPETIRKRMLYSHGRFLQPIGKMKGYKRPWPSISGSDSRCICMRCIRILDLGCRYGHFTSLVPILVSTAGPFFHPVVTRSCIFFLQSDHQ